MLLQSSLEKIAKVRYTLKYLNINCTSRQEPDVPEAKQPPPQSIDEFKAIYNLALARKIAYLSTLGSQLRMLSAEQTLSLQRNLDHPENEAVEDLIDAINDKFKRHFLDNQGKFPRGIEEHLHVALLEEDDTRGKMIELIRLPADEIQRMVVLENAILETLEQAIKACDERRKQEIIRKARLAEELIDTISFAEDGETHRKTMQFLHLLDEMDLGKQGTAFSILLGKSAAVTFGLENAKAHLMQLILAGELPHASSLIEALCDANPKSSEESVTPKAEEIRRSPSARFLMPAWMSIFEDDTKRGDRPAARPTAAATAAAVVQDEDFDGMPELVDMREVLRELPPGDKHNSGGSAAGVQPR